MNIPRSTQELTMRPHLFLCLLKRLTVLTGLLLVMFAHGAVAATTTPNFVQGNYSAPSTPQTKVTVTYKAAQTAGNLNVVMVGRSDNITQVSSVTDSKGNVYQLAVGPTVQTGANPVSQSIYYAKKISAATAGTNTVTVNFSAAASYPDVRILEYSGVDPSTPVDVSAAATGNSANSSSASVATKNSVDLLVGANVVWTATTGPGSGLTERLLTNDGDIVEDRVVTATGSYSTSAPLNSAGPWVMQMVAFRAAGSPTPTPTPTPAQTTAALSYVQGNFAAPHSSLTSVPVKYAAAQGAGHLNVVIVGWNDATAQVKSLSDTKGNVYQLAVGPTLLTGSNPRSQSIYYAKNILAATAGSNTVTAAFTAAAYYPDIRILEYSGIDTATPVDVSAAATGNSTSSGSGTVTTKNANDLLVAANVVWTSTTGPGSGWTKRLLTSDGDITEDRVVTATGSVSASAPLSSAGPWVMQIVAFRAAKSSSAVNSSSSTPAATPKPTPTPTPKPTPTPTATPKPTSTPTSSSITLAWTAAAATSNPATNPVGYRLHLGLSSATYTQTTTLGNVTTVKVSNLTKGQKYYCAVSAYNSANVDSPMSNQVSFTAP
jgi:glycine/D-amino acid oxidase-like deaminating enzyme